MEHTDMEQVEISWGASRPSSKTIALALPEILYNIFTFLDPPTLENCLQVSRLWYTHGRTLAWRTLHVNLLLFLGLACDIHVADDSDMTGKAKKKKNKKEKQDNVEDRLQEFIENCHHIRSLTLTTPQSSNWTNLNIPDTLDPRVAGLRNLNHFGVDFQRHPWGLPISYQLAGAILSQNPGIQEIDWRQDDRIKDEELRDHMLKRVVGGKLKKLTVNTYFRESKMQFLKYLIDANKELQEQRYWQEQKQQEGGTMNQGPPIDESVKEGTASGNGNDSSQGNGDNGGHGFQLEELVLRDCFGYQSRTERSKLNLEWLYDCWGTLPIRALSFVNFETWTRHPVIPEDEEQGDRRVRSDEPGSSILPILSKCPQLEKLCVSFDLHSALPENSPYSFIYKVSENHHYCDESSGFRVGKEDEDFVVDMYEYCPRLREIEFGMYYQLTSDHWIEMMGTYGHQLVSLSIWGNVTEFNSKAFMALIDRPISYVSDDGFHPLTRLNINGMEHLHDCAWMALYLLPHLKEFRASYVPLDANSLIEEEWVCQGLEVLEIYVVIPRRTQWQWSDARGWEKGFNCYQRDMRGCVDGSKDDGTDDEDSDDDEHNRDDTAKALRRRLRYLATKSPRKKTRKDVMKCNDAQVKVCEALGRLTHLRELRIEGGRHVEFGNRNWGCLELTLETGLEHLAPLQQNLEKLVVSELGEGLSGRKEVEWIACNWVHHSNTRWLEQHNAPSQSKEEPERHGMAGVRYDDDDDVSFDPRSKFKELIGISGNTRDAISNIKWLREQCPTLSVIEVLEAEDEDE